MTSSFGEVVNASLSSWRSVRRPEHAIQCNNDQTITYPNNTEIFSDRSQLMLPRTVDPAELEHISFHAFWRLFHTTKKLHRRMKEKFLSVSGLGYPAQADREHPQHEEYALKHLCAYMPCPGLQGLDYVHAVVMHFYRGSFADALRDFVDGPLNKWCPTWVSKNYAMLNKHNEEEEEVSPKSAEATVNEAPETKDATRGATSQTHRAKGVVLLDENGEPQLDPKDEKATSLDPWSASGRAPWEKHSEMGPNLRPLPRAPSEVPWVPNTNPPE